VHEFTEKDLPNPVLPKYPRERRKCNMAIAYATLNGNNYVVAKDEKGKTLFTGPGADQIIGTTATTVTIKKGHNIIVLDERGKTISVR